MVNSTSPNGLTRLGSFSLPQNSVGPALALVVIFASSALSPPAWIDSTFDFHRLLEVSFLLIVGILAAAKHGADNFLSKSLKSRPPVALCAITAFFFLGLLSSFHAPLPRYSLIDISTYFLIFISTLSISSFITDNHHFSIFIIAALFVVASCYLLSFFVGFALDLTTPLHMYGFDLFPGFATARFVNQIQTWTLPLIGLVPLWATKQNRLRLAASILIVSLWWMLLWLSGGRGTSIAISVAALIVLLLYKRRALAWLTVEAATASIGYGLYVIMFGAQASENMIGKGLALDGRGTLWRRAWTLIQAHPWLGIGPMQFAFYSRTIAAHPHDSVLLIACEWGIPAACIAAFIAGWALFRWVHHCQEALCRPGHPQRDKQLKVALTAALLAAGVHSLVSGIIVMPVSQMLLTVVVGWAQGIYDRESAAASVVRPPSARATTLLRITSLIVAIVLAACVAPDIPGINQRVLHYKASHPRAILEPRLWQQGIIGG